MEIFNGKAASSDVKLLIFDLDGTIADTIITIEDALNMLMSRYGYPELDYEQTRIAVGKGSLDLVRRAVPKDVSCDEARVVELHEEYLKYYRQTLLNCNECYEGMRDSLIALKEKGYKLAVLSNKKDEFTKAMVKVLVPEGTFSRVQGQTDLPTKPNPTVPLMIASELGFLPEETAFVGDSEVDVQTGLNSGMLAVGCSWGYRPRDLLISTGAHVILDKPCELKELFLK